MEVKAGYKQTEVGVIPEEWVVECLDECVRSEAPICYGILMPGQHHDGGVPVVKVRDIIGGRIDESNLLLTHPSIDEAYKRSRLAPEDVLITIRGTTGRLAIVSSALKGANITQDTARLRVKDGVSPQFIYCALQSATAQQQVALHTIGQAVKGINIRDVKRIAVARPPLSEQRAIAAALNDVDALIDSLGQLIAKKRDLKQAAMQQLLTGKKRLPGFTGEWEEKQLGDCLLARPEYGINAPAVPYSDRLPTYIRITDISEHGRFCPDPRVSVKAASANQYYLREGDV